MQYIWKTCAIVLVLGLGLLSAANTAYAAIGYIYQNNFVSGYTANAIVETFPAPSLPANCRITIVLLNELWTGDVPRKFF